MDFRNGNYVMFKNESNPALQNNTSEYLLKLQQIFIMDYQDRNHRVFLSIVRLRINYCMDHIEICMELQQKGFSFDDLLNGQNLVSMIYVIRNRNNPALSDRDRNLYYKIFERLVEWYNKFDNIIQEVFKNKSHVLKELGYDHD